MLLTDHDLLQIDSEYLRGLSAEKLLNISLNLLESLKEARDRLNQNPQNSSRPSGSFAPWEGLPLANSAADDSASDNTSDNTSENTSDNTSDNAKEKKADLSSISMGQKQAEKSEKKSAGKQVGAEGHGRQVTLPVTGIESHRACECAACGALLTQESLFVPRTGLYVLDLEVKELEMKVSHIKHLYGETHCACGHITLTEPGRCEKEDGWVVQLSQWHLVGPTLASLIICLALRMRLSRRRIQEWLKDWLGIWLSVGVINQSITEGGRACEPIEEELIDSIRQSVLLHADETGWKENGRLVWLWVLITANTTLFLIGRRSWDVIADVLEGSMCG